MLRDYVAKLPSAPSFNLPREIGGSPRDANSLDSVGRIQFPHFVYYARTQ